MEKALAMKLRKVLGLLGVDAENEAVECFSHDLFCTIK